MVSTTGNRIEFLCTLSLVSVVSAQLLGNPERFDGGVGTRALSMGNSYVAQAMDVSGLFWNPGGLGLAKDKQVEVTFGGLRPTVLASLELDGNHGEQKFVTQRLRMGNVGILRPSDMGTGKLGIGAAFQNPYWLDAGLHYGAQYQSADDTIDVCNEYVALGQLDFWTGGLGIQLARNFGVGFSLSLITGKGTDELRFEKQTNGSIVDVYNDHYCDVVSRQYTGLDARVGLLYQSPWGLLMGARIVFPSTICFSERGCEYLPAIDNECWSYKIRGTMKSYYSGAFGLAYECGLGTLTSEINARAPQPTATLDASYQGWKMGGGLGLEIPLLSSSFLIRAGYGWQEYDPNPYTVNYDEATDSESVPEPRSLSGKHMFTGGCAYQINKHISLSFSYAYQTYSLNTDNVLEERHKSQRLLAGISVRH